MSTRIYTINRALVLPLALNAVLLLTVLALTAVRPSTAAERVLLAAALVPMAVIAVEASLRRVAVGDAGLVLSKFFKQRSLQWADITHVGALAVRRKVYLVLTTTKGFTSCPTPTAGSGTSSATCWPTWKPNGSRKARGRSSRPPARTARIDLQPGLQRCCCWSSRP